VSDLVLWREVFRPLAVEKKNAGPAQGQDRRFIRRHFSSSQPEVYATSAQRSAVDHHQYFRVRFQNGRSGTPVPDSVCRSVLWRPAVGQV